MIKHPTAPRGNDTRLGLTIGIQTAPGYEPESYFRGTDVGVGGRHGLADPLGLGPCDVRKATLGELRRLDRIRIAQMLERFPGGTITVRRSRL